MSNHSDISWTDATWNSIAGCTKISPGCKHCYAAKMTRRLQASPLTDKYRNGFGKITCHEEELTSDVVTGRKPKMIFVNSMSDTFHKDVPSDFIRRVFEVMNQHRQHIYQVLTKRSERLLNLAPHLPWADHIWMGVTVESADYVHRIEHLRQTPAKHKFLSLEPLLGPLPDLNLKGIDWVIVGGESGSNERPMDPNWVRNIRDQCIDAGVPFFFKQWGGFRKKAGGNFLDGRQWEAMPRLAMSEIEKNVCESKTKGEVK